ncbi:hypothetical protein BJX61DRAFT_541600 [Aspergillus egyptiacus]|nr:hypothetical protein BJX61DRAFT_541600 [Aspergillus egyptiacus]
MENLRSFSIIPTTPYSMYSRYYSATASRKMLSQVLLALPPTVTSLEIAAAWDWDTNRSKSTPCCEGCNSIREILPRLRHIRLRMPCLCMGLLSPFTDETRPLLLERAVIWLSGRPTVNIFPCGTQVRLVDDETKSWNQAKPLRQAVVSDALRLYLSGALPHIQQFTFLDTKTMWGNPVDPDLDMVLKYDIINGETSAYPMSSVYDWRGSGSHNNYILRLPDPSTEQDVPHPGVKDYVGLYNSLIPILEGPTGWTQACNGSRLPCALTELSGYEGGYTFHATPGCTHSTELLSRIGHAGSFWTEGAGNLQPAKAPCLPGNVVIERSGPELEDGSRAYAVVVQPYPEAPAIAP